jgi:drug/metabolite transporter (DMT)-like permease
MSPAVLALIAVGAVSHATWNLWIKHRRAGGPVFLWMSSAVASLAVAPFGVAALLSAPVEPGAVVIAGLVSAILHVAYFLLLQHGYRVGDVSVVYPLARGSGPLLSVIGAVLLLGERPAPVALAGAGAVVAGVLVIGFAGGAQGRRDARSGVLFGVLTGVAIAAYTLWDAHAVTAFAVPPVLLSLGGTIGEVSLMTPFAVRRRSELRAMIRRHWFDAVVVGVLSPLSYIVILIALQEAPVAIVAPGREVSVVLVSLAGWLLFREPHPAQRILGALVVLGGVGMLALS